MWRRILSDEIADPSRRARSARSVDEQPILLSGTVSGAVEQLSAQQAAHRFGHVVTDTTQCHGPAILIDGPYAQAREALGIQRRARRQHAERRECRVAHPAQRRGAGVVGGLVEDQPSGVADRRGVQAQQIPLFEERELGGADHDDGVLLVTGVGEQLLEQVPRIPSSEARASFADPPLHPPREF